MLWAALLPAPKPSDNDSPFNTDALQGIALWCLQFTPRVSIVEESVVMEVEASVRLHGGKRKLVERIRDECSDVGVDQLSWAPTSLAALALARSRLVYGFGKPINQILDPLPLETISAVAAHAPTLARLGCRTLEDVRKLPRGGISRRFDKELLAAMDCAYGTRPEAHEWVALPEEFHAHLELMSRVEMAPAILFGARRLLMQMCAWLAARRAGVTAFTLTWCHDVMRSRTAGVGGELTIRTAEPTRQIEHLCRLLAENLAKVQLLAPVGDLELIATDVRALEEHNASLLPDPKANGESLALCMERIAARLGPQSVLRPVETEDYRLEWSVHWQTAADPQPRNAPAPTGLPQPTFMLPSPLKLASKGNRPMFQGPLHLLTGPHRVEGGWWHRVGKGSEERAMVAVRDYWVALSEHAGVLWIFSTRLDGEHLAWFLHGSF